MDEKAPEGNALVFVPKELVPKEGAVDAACPKFPKPVGTVGALED